MTRALLAAALLLSITLSAAAQEAGIKAFSKYDFVPGTQIISFEDFADDAVGDFPDGWEPDTRNRLLTEGKWVTHGILFDVNSDRIRGESYGTLKEIAAVLKENPAVRVRIVGHTDSDGDDASNLDLSRRRAAAVKTALAAEFGIESARMETEGRGESEPAAGNDTAAGKANNRRVEFLKL
jgi:outer membrane protein OmpA-like peptidoglycan-associated protein